MNYKLFDGAQYAKTTAKQLLNKAALFAMQCGALAQGELVDFVIEVPGDTKHGDFAANIALVNAKALGAPPRKIADAILFALDDESFAADKALFSRFEVAGPGFINIFLAGSYYNNVLNAAIAEGENYGRTAYGNGEKINVEFVSANPTGPMHLGNARGGAIGDTIAETLYWSGHDVTREFLINNAGNQIDKFAQSLEARYLQLYKSDIAFEESWYQGGDIIERAQGFAAINGAKFVEVDDIQRRRALIEYALPKNIDDMRLGLMKYRIEFDVWFPESTLHDSGQVQAVIELLTKNGSTYEKDGAIWYKTENEQEKDEVLVRQNGVPTYFAADIAYHYNKFVTRGFERAIDVWGADHHGHIARLKGALRACGLDDTKFDIVLMQLVRLMQNGEIVRMSKRTGKAITLSTLLDEVPLDAARFFFNMREPATHLDFDLGLAVENSSDNPVYYVQYANARINSIIKALAAEGVQFEGAQQCDTSLLCTEAELALIKQIGAFPSAIYSAAKAYNPAILTNFVIELATLFHKFYTTSRVKNEQPPLMQARIMLCLAAKTVIENTLTILKISKPEVM